MTNYVAYTLIDITNTNETKIARNKLHFSTTKFKHTYTNNWLALSLLDIAVLPLMAQDVVNFGS